MARSSLKQKLLCAKNKLIKKVVEAILGYPVSLYWNKLPKDVTKCKQCSYIEKKKLKKLEDGEI